MSQLGRHIDLMICKHCKEENMNFLYPKDVVESLALVDFPGNDPNAQYSRALFSLKLKKWVHCKACLETWEMSGLEILKQAAKKKANK